MVAVTCLHAEIHLVATTQTGPVQIKINILTGGGSSDSSNFRLAHRHTNSMKKKREKTSERKPSSRQTTRARWRAGWLAGEKTTTTATRSEQAAPDAHTERRTAAKEISARCRVLCYRIGETGNWGTSGAVGLLYCSEMRRKRTERHGRAGGNSPEGAAT